MKREILIKNTAKNMALLSDKRLREVSDFTEFLLSKMENQLIVDGIQQLVSESKAFNFLENEEDLYSEADLKEKYK